MNKRLQIGRVLALSGGIWGAILVLLVGYQQLHVAAVLRGEMPISMMIMNNAIPFLGLTLAVCLLAIGLAIGGQRVNPIVTGMIWLMIGIVFFYLVYQARFSIGVFLIPLATLMLSAGIITLWRGMQR